MYGAGLIPRKRIFTFSGRASEMTGDYGLMGEAEGSIITLLEVLSGSHGESLALRRFRGSFTDRET